MAELGIEPGSSVSKSSLNYKPILMVCKYKRYKDEINPNKVFPSLISGTPDRFLKGKRINYSHTSGVVCVCGGKYYISMGGGIVLQGDTKTHMTRKAEGKAEALCLAHAPVK